MARKTGKRKKCALDSVLDLNARNVWAVDEHQLAALWQKDSVKENFANKEEKLLNTIRLAFDVVLYERDDDRSKQMYENGEWATFRLVGRKGTNVAIRVKQIKRLSDLNSENVKRITAATVVELIERNFGCGWEAISSNIKDLLESAFYIITTQLPTSRMHAPGGTLERKVKEGYEVLEIPRGTWTEAIFVKKKELIESDELDVMDDKDDELDADLTDDADLIIDDNEEDDNEGDESIIEEEFNEDDTFYEDYMEEPELDDGENMGFGFMDEEE